MDDEIIKGLPRTLSLAIGAALLWMFVAICFGLYSAMKAGKFADRFLTIIALIGISMPVFWIGALMNHYLGFKLGWFPNGGYVEFTEDPVDWAYHLILPWTALAILFIGSTRACCARTCSTRSTRTTCERPRPRGSPSARSWSGTSCATR